MCVCSSPSKIPARGIQRRWEVQAEMQLAPPIEPQSNEEFTPNDSLPPDTGLPTLIEVLDPRLIERQARRR